MSDLSERLYSLRNEHRLTQDDAAKELGISMKSYCRYEKDEREPSASVLIQMARFYQVSLDYLVGMKDERQ